MLEGGWEGSPQNEVRARFELLQAATGEAGATLNLASQETEHAAEAEQGMAFQRRRQRSLVWLEVGAHLPPQGACKISTGHGNSATRLEMLRNPSGRIF